MSGKHVFVGAALVMAAAVGLTAVRPAAGEGSEADNVTRSCSAFKTSWNAHDAKAVATVFDEEGDMIDPMGHRAIGREAVQKAFMDDYGPTGPMRDSSLVVETEYVRFPTADTAVTDAEAVLSGVYGPDGKKADPIKVHVTNVWKKVGGNWLVYSSRPYIKPPAPAK